MIVDYYGCDDGRLPKVRMISSMISVVGGLETKGITRSCHEADKGNVLSAPQKASAARVSGSRDKVDGNGE